MALRPVQFNILRYQASFRWRAFSLARRGSKQASGEHVEERMFDSIPGAARICGAIPRKPQNRASANCEMWALIVHCHGVQRLSLGMVDGWHRRGGCG